MFSSGKNKSFKIRKRAVFWGLIFFIYALTIKIFPLTRWIGELLALSLSVFIPFFLVLTIYFTFRVRLQVLTFLPGLILLIHPIQNWFAFSLPAKKLPEKTFKVASFNTATMDLERFTRVNNGDTTFQNDYSAMYHWVRENKDLDVLCLQEFYDSFKPEMAGIIDSIFKAGDFRYFCINPSFSKQHAGFFGVIVFSKKIPIHCKKIIFGKDEVLNKGIYLDFMDENQDTLRVINLHLSSMSIRLDPKTKKRKIHFPIVWIKDTYLRLKYGYEQRELEMDNIEKLLEESPSNTILCGDFNATPHMNANRRMREKFRDAFLISGFGPGFTYHHFPHIIRIDFQYYRGAISSLTSYTNRNVKFSDHYPIITEYKLPGRLKNQVKDTTLEFIP